MPYKSLDHFVTALENSGELIRVKESVSPRLEITEIADRFVKNEGKALLFENTGTPFPLLINSFGTEKRMCMALGVEDLDDISRNIDLLFKDLASPRDRFLDKLRLIPSLKQLSSWMPHRVRSKGKCQEVVMEPPDLGKLPVLTCWPFDGGPFITLPVVHTVDPVTGIRNVGMYRMQVFDPVTTGMHWHLHKGSAAHFDKYKSLRRKMPVSVTLGGDPVYTYVATAPLPENLDEYLLAGFIRGKRVEMVKCLTNDLEVPADADFVIEGFVDPMEEPALEGPFGDHTGFYSLADYFPKFHVTCITHRKKAVYPATIVGIPPMEDKFIGKATERIFLSPMKISVVPELTDLHMPAEGVFHNIALARIDKKFPGQAAKVMNALWGAGQMMFNKIMVVTDGETILEDYPEMIRIIAKNTDPVDDILFTRGPVDILDHSSRKYAFGSKMGVDATVKLEQEKKGNVQTVLPVAGLKVKLVGRFPEIEEVNDSLPAQDISILLVSARKSKKDHIRELGAKLVQENLLAGIKFVIFTDPETDLSDLSAVVWICANNLDPERDCFYTYTSGNVPYPCLFFDGTRKLPSTDDFSREWPNIIAMDDKTIQTIDEKWNDLGLGPFFSSPSVKYKKLVISDGAVCLNKISDM